MKRRSRSVGHILDSNIDATRARENDEAYFNYDLPKDEDLIPAC